jgi:hypothetical protein
MAFGYIARNFQVLKTLYELSRVDPILSEEAVESVLSAHEEDVSLDRLMEHQILLRIDEHRYELALPLAEAIGYFSEEHSLNSPESIRKYEHSFEGLRNTFSVAMKQNDIVRLSIDITRELRSFRHDMEAMVNELMREARELKSNKEQRDYRQRLDAAIGIVDNYITPINALLNGKHDGTIFSLLIDINKHAYTKRENQPDVNVKGSLENLRSYLQEVIDRLTQISRTVIDELVPLIRGVQRSSRIVQGALLFIGKDSVPEHMRLSFGERVSREDFAPFDFFSEAVDRITGLDLDASEIRISFEAAEMPKSRAPIDLTKIRAKVTKSLPVQNYHQWIMQNIDGEKKSIRDLSQCMALLKGADAKFTGKRIQLELEEGILDAPIIELNKIDRKEN